IDHDALLAARRRDDPAVGLPRAGREPHDEHERPLQGLQRDDTPGPTLAPETIEDACGAAKENQRVRRLAGAGSTAQRSSTTTEGQWRPAADASASSPVADTNDVGCARWSAGRRRAGATRSSVPPRGRSPCW